MYPIGEQYTTTILNISQNLWTIILVIICTAFIEKADFTETGDKTGAYNSFMTMPIISAFAFLLCLFINQDLKRQEAEKLNK